MKLGSRERRLLLLLPAFVALALLVRWIGADSGGGVGSGDQGSTGTAGEQEGVVRQVVALDLSALRPQQGTYEVDRDPFRYGALPPPPPTPPPPPVPTPETVAAVPAPPPWRPPPPPPPPSFAHLRFLGTFGPPDGRIAVVLSSEEIYNVREGAVIEGRFIVQEIGFESLAIAFVGFPDAAPQRLPVGGSG